MSAVSLERCAAPSSSSLSLASPLSLSFSSGIFGSWGSWFCCRTSVTVSVLAVSWPSLVFLSCVVEVRLFELITILSRMVRSWVVETARFPPDAVSVL